jgi:hypothetical protein
MIWRKHAILTPPTDEEMVQMEPDELIGLHSVYHEAIENAEKDRIIMGSASLTGVRLKNNYLR